MTTTASTQDENSRGVALLQQQASKILGEIPQPGLPPPTRTARWVILEIKGYRTVAGRLVSGEPPFNLGVVVDMPIPPERRKGADEFVQESYRPDAIFSARLVSEEEARRTAAGSDHLDQVLRSMEPPEQAETPARGWARSQVYEAIDKRRAQQDQQWGGAAHDDQHSIDDWAGFIGEHMSRASGCAFKGQPRAEVRASLVDVAALAVAALESLDRQIQRERDLDSMQDDYHDEDEIDTDEEPLL